jgi:hypothetical protein
MIIRIIIQSLELSILVTIGIIAIIDHHNHCTIKIQMLTNRTASADRLTDESPMTAKNGVGFKSRKWLANQFGGLYNPKNVCIDLHLIVYYISLHMCLSHFYIMISSWYPDYFIWVCLKIVYPYTQWFCWSLSLLNGYNWGYTPFSDIPMLLLVNHQLIVSLVG